MEISLPWQVMRSLSLLPLNWRNKAKKSDFLQKTALITGVYGQDGHYLGKLLLGKGYRVIGTGLAAKSGTMCEYVQCDVSSERQVLRLIKEKKPDEIYNLAVFLSGVWRGVDQKRAVEVNVKGPLNLLSAMEQERPSARLFQASTGYIFKPSPKPLNEKSAIGPANDHARTKWEAHKAVLGARKRGLFAVNGILFNHESPLRPRNFLVHKVTDFAARAKRSMQQGKLRLGNIRTVRDWGFAGDYAEAMRLMLCSKKPDDYVVATGAGHTAEDACKAAFSEVGLDYKHYLEIDKKLFREKEVDFMVGNPSLIKRELGWHAKTSFEELVKMMVQADLNAL